MFTEYTSHQDFADAVGSGLTAAPADISQAVLDGVLQGEDEWRAESDSSAKTPRELEFRVGRWFLRTEDVPFLESIAAASAFATGVTAGAALPATLITAVAAFAGVAWRVWRSGGRLTPAQVDVLGVLSAEESLEQARLLKRMNGSGTPWDAKTLQKTLLDLSSFEVNDGRTVALVEQLPDDRWRAKNV